MAYKEYALRAPTVQDAIDSAKAALTGEGLDPYELEVLRKDDEGNDVLGRVVDAVQAGRWYEIDPTYDSDGNLADPGTKGTYALINIRTKNETLKSFIEEFAVSAPAKDPADIPDADKIGTGLHRIDETQISSPERVWATAGN